MEQEHLTSPKNVPIKNNFENFLNDDDISLSTTLRLQKHATLLLNKRERDGFKLTSLLLIYNATTTLIICNYVTNN